MHQLFIICLEAVLNCDRNFSSVFNGVVRGLCLSFDLIENEGLLWMTHWKLNKGLNEIMSELQCSVVSEMFFQWLMCSGQWGEGVLEVLGSVASVVPLTTVSDLFQSGFVLLLLYCFTFLSNIHWSLSVLAPSVMCGWDWRRFKGHRLTKRRRL